MSKFMNEATYPWKVDGLSFIHVLLVCSVNYVVVGRRNDFSGDIGNDDDVGHAPVGGFFRARILCALVISSEGCAAISIPVTQAVTALNRSHRDRRILSRG